ncbi:hypothetical protein A5886_002299 [Enterococcus sp. 8G7_MSG3316]|uniref:Uncharacterized protein n=1 Tax=Candidatus Enterococcus testudinis TaxID=1834191 RepID=A0A242A8C4_9ENTE|nr:hypothetical protein A5886_002299 [Enterococcus sp. 8G7_MSG3316]
MPLAQSHILPLVFVSDETFLNQRGAHFFHLLNSFVRLNCFHP